MMKWSGKLIIMASCSFANKVGFDHKMSSLEGRKGVKLELEYSILTSF